MRLIDADALLVELDDLRFPGAPYVDAGVAIAIGKVCDAPTIEERKTGKWIVIDECSNEGVYCSECHKKVFKADYSNTMKWKNFKFCPNCGAQMEMMAERREE